MADASRKHDKVTDSDLFWGELVGGPFDGQMAQITRTTIRFKDGTVRVSRGLWVPEANGHYVEDGFADEALAIVRMRWRHDQP